MSRPEGGRPVIRVDIHHVTLEACGPDVGHRVSLRLPAVPRVGESIEFGDITFIVTSVMWVTDDDAHVGDGAIDSHLAVYYVIAAVEVA